MIVAHTREMPLGSLTERFLDEFDTTTSCFMNGYKIYIYWEDTTALHGKNNLQHLYQPESDTLIEIILEDTSALHRKIIFIIWIYHKLINLLA